MNSRLRRLAVLGTLAGAPALLGGCATLTKGSSQNITVTTDPIGAICTLTREGEVIGIVNPTPGTLNVSKSHTDLVVRCVKDDYVDAVGNVGSKFQAMTFGNILFGGLVGVVVDAASGASAEYEPTITIRLVPAVFTSAEERDRFFDQRRDEFVAEAQKVKERIDRMCAGESCAQQLADAEKEQAAGLARIEEQRRSARVVAAAQ